MIDLIKRSDAIEVAKAFWYKPDIAGALAELPTIEPKRGEWITMKNPRYEYDREQGDLFAGVAFICSECGNSNGAFRSNFCPNCGADMREREGE